MRRYASRNVISPMLCFTKRSSTLISKMTPLVHSRCNCSQYHRVRNRRDSQRNASQNDMAACQNHFLKYANQLDQVSGEIANNRKPRSLKARGVHLVCTCRTLRLTEPTDSCSNGSILIAPGNNRACISSSVAVHIQAATIEPPDSIPHNSISRAQLPQQQHNHRALSNSVLLCGICQSQLLSYHTHQSINVPDDPEMTRGSRPSSYRARTTPR